MVAERASRRQADCEVISVFGVHASLGLRTGNYGEEALLRAQHALAVGEGCFQAAGGGYRASNAA